MFKNAVFLLLIVDRCQSDRLLHNQWLHFILVQFKKYMMGLNVYVDHITVRLRRLVWVGRYTCWTCSTRDLQTGHDWKGKTLGN